MNAGERDNASHESPPHVRAAALAGQHVVDQEHSTYSSQAHRVWAEVLARNAAVMSQFGDRLHPAYILGMRELDLPMLVPRMDELNARLRPTGWSTVCVDGYVPTPVYVSLMARRVFPVSRTVRRPEHVDFAPEPDLVHDVLGHLPMLFSEEYRAYLQRLAGIMSRASANALDESFFTTVRELAAVRSNPSSSPLQIEHADRRMLHVVRAIADNTSEMTHLRRMYVWSVEFGLLGDRERPQVYGAALLSAPAELRVVCEGTPTLRAFDISVIERENAFSDVLNEYYTAASFAELNDVLSLYERRMSGAKTP
jgi:phenylalanine-4-hydroxylase